MDIALKKPGLYASLTYNHYQSLTSLRQVEEKDVGQIIHHSLIEMEARSFSSFISSIA